MQLFTGSHHDDRCAGCGGAHRTFQVQTTFNAEDSGGHIPAAGPQPS